MYGHSHYSVSMWYSYLCFFLIFPGTIHAEVYEYPFNNPYIATIVGTSKEYRANVFQNITIRAGALEKEIGPEIPDIMLVFSGSVDTVVSAILWSQAQHLPGAYDFFSLQANSA